MLSPQSTQERGQPLGEGVLSLACGGELNPGDHSLQRVC